MRSETTWSAPRPVLPEPPRILAEHQPAELREHFASAYPNGIPGAYNMCAALLGGVANKYIEDNLPLGFYTNPPAAARAIFSTRNGEREFRRMMHILPRRRLYLWHKNQIQETCNSLRMANWEAMRIMVQPLCWDDLWHYFDAFDLYHNGAINLWNVINHLFAENRIIYPDLMKICALEVGHWADEWTQRTENAKKLKSWEASKGPVIQILDEKDWGSLGSLNDDTIPILSNALKCRRDHLLMPGRNPSAAARDLISSSRSEVGLENWMTGQAFHPGSGLPLCRKGEPINAKNFEPPCVVVNGKHYWAPKNTMEELKRRPKGAVEALKKSVEALSSADKKLPNIVIANDSPMSPSHYPLATRITIPDSFDAKKLANEDNQTQPSSSDGCMASLPSQSGKTSHSGSPRRLSDSAVRPKVKQSSSDGIQSCTTNVLSVPASTGGELISQPQGQAPVIVSGQA